MAKAKRKAPRSKTTKARPVKGPGRRPGPGYHLVRRGGQIYWMKKRFAPRASWQRWASGLADALGIPREQLVIRLMLKEARRIGYKGPRPKQLPATAGFYRPEDEAKRK